MAIVAIVVDGLIRARTAVILFRSTRRLGSPLTRITRLCNNTASVFIIDRPILTLNTLTLVRLFLTPAFPGDRMCIWR